MAFNNFNAVLVFVALSGVLSCCTSSHFHMAAQWSSMAAASQQGFAGFVDMRQSALWSVHFGMCALVRPHLQQFEDGGQVGLLHEAVLLGVVELVQSARRDLLRRVIKRHQKAEEASKVQHK